MPRIIISKHENHSAKIQKAKDPGVGSTRDFFLGYVEQIPGQGRSRTAGNTSSYVLRITEGLYQKNYEDNQSCREFEIM